MSDDVKKPVSRKERSAATRRRIVAAATGEFVGSGYHGTSMAGIAQRAGVAVQTVYFVFHTKPELFAAVLDAAVLGEDARPPLGQAWAQAAFDQASRPKEAIAAFVRGSGPIFRRASAVSEVARAAAPTDPELAAAWSYREGLRVDTHRLFVAALADALPAGFDVDRAGDVLLTMVNPSTYLTLAGFGWSHDAIVDWLAVVVPNLMLGDGLS